MDVDELIDRAKGEIDRTLLEGTGGGSYFSTGYFGDGPLLDLLRDKERVDYVLQNFKKGLTIENAAGVVNLQPGANHRTALVVTNSRLLFVVGCQDGDETVSVPFEEVRDVEIAIGILKDRISVHADDARYEMYVRWGADLEGVATHILDAARSSETREKSTGCPTDEIDGDQKERSHDDVQCASATSEAQSSDEMEADGSGNNIDPSTKSQSSLEILASDTDGDPVPNATVTVKQDVFHVSGKTSSAGRCTITFPHTVSSAEIKIDHPRYETIHGEMSVKDGAAIDVTLTESESTEGKPSPKQSGEAGKRCQQGEEVETPTREALLQALIDLQKMTNNRVTRFRMRVDGEFDPEHYEEEFGSWSAALDSVTLPEEDPRNASSSSSNQEAYSKAEVLDAIADVAEEVGGHPSTEEMSEYGRMSVGPAYRFFDSWSDAVTEAIKYRKVCGTSASSSSSEQEAYSKREILDAIAEVAETVDGTPSTIDMNEHGRMSAGPIYRFFDSWSDAVAEAMRLAPGEPEDTSTTTTSDDGSEPVEESISDDPLANGIANASRGRHSGVVVEVLTVSDTDKPRRDAEVVVRTRTGEEVVLNVWEKHDVDWQFEAGNLLRFDDVRLKRWGDDDDPSHHLSTTRDFSVTKLDETSEAVVDTTDPVDTPSDTTSDPVERLIGLGGATETDAAILIEAGYETPEDLKSATLEELRSLPALDDGVALRIKAELG